MGFSKSHGAGMIFKIPRRMHDFENPTARAIFKIPRRGRMVFKILRRERDFQNPTTYVRESG